jgi:mannosyltransferase OCH1-like enzyme
MIMKIDYGKYVIMRHYGGVYVDMDTNPVKPLDKLLQPEGSVVLSYSPTDFNIKISKIVKIIPKEFVNNAFIATIPSHILWSHLLENVIPSRIVSLNTLMPEGMIVLYTVGPFALSEAVQDVKKIYADEIRLLSPDFIEPTSHFISDTEAISKNTYVVHKSDSKWASPFVKHLRNYAGVYILLGILLVVIAVIRSAKRALHFMKNVGVV